MLRDLSELFQSTLQKPSLSTFRQVTGPVVVCGPGSTLLQVKAECLKVNTKPYETQFHTLKYGYNQKSRLGHLGGSDV